MCVEALIFLTEHAAPLSDVLMVRDGKSHDVFALFDTF